MRTVGIFGRCTDNFDRCMSVLVARPLFEGVVVVSTMFVCSENNIEKQKPSQSKYGHFQFANFYRPIYILQLMLILIQAIDLIRIIL